MASKTSYNNLMKILHWATVLLLLSQFITIWLSQLGYRLKDKAFGMEMIDLHKALGLAIIATVTIRLLWRHIGGLPDWAQGLQKWEKTAAHKLEVWLYRLLFAIPITGMIYSITSGYPIHFFDLFSIPKLMDYNRLLSNITWFIHMLSAYLLTANVALHIGFVARRSIFEKDGYIRRMI